MIKNRQIKVGVIGVGQMGVHHVRIYSNMANVNLVGISDIDIVRGTEIANKFNTVYFENSEDLLGKDLDALSIAVPTSLHKEVAQLALDYGANLLVEKPLADTTENAWEIIRKAERQKRILMVGHIERFNPAIESLKNLLALETMGKIVNISTLRVAPYPQRIQDAGIILDVSCHDIDLISYLTGKKAKSVTTEAKQEFHKYEDEARIFLEYEDGSSAVVETSWHYPYKNRRLLVQLEKGAILINFMRQSLTVFDSVGAVSVPVHQGEPLSRELHTFIDAVANDLPSPVNGEDSIYTLNVTSSAVTSYQKNKRIKLGNPTRNNTYTAPVLAMI
ncbi:Gfo/Idh/MocA family oxidoreductase [bacterium]|nr:Gfo/Idh/MocA family oxidoreductase [bacterium]MBU1025292.1 Gfo/Idh/MocA family oxidoreductase [bacterium]